MLQPLLGQTRLSSPHLHVFQLLKHVSRPTLWPYYLLSLTYMFLHSPFHPHPPETAGAALLKILPIWYLVVYVLRSSRRHGKLHSSRVNNSEIIHMWDVTHAGDMKEQKVTHIGGIKQQKVTHAGDIKEQEVTNSTMRPSFKTDDSSEPNIRHFVVSLVFSSVGDVCLNYKKLFLLGVGFFSFAHVFILLTLRKRFKSCRKAWLAVPLCFLLYFSIWAGIIDAHFKVVVLIYSILIHSMLFFAIASYESHPSAATFSNILGASLFVFSDFLIAYNKWLRVTAHSQLSILSTYYLAQVLLAVGFVHQTPSVVQHLASM